VGVADDADAGWLAVDLAEPGLTADPCTVPHPAASAPATSRGTEKARVCRASRAIDAIDAIEVIM
jgi:hypothetical protein